MRKQQKFWRQQKQNLKRVSEYYEDSPQGHVCDSCRNHEKIVIKKNHECPYADCPCEFCCLTRKRREVMKQLQRVKRCSTIKANKSSQSIIEDILKQEECPKKIQKTETSSGSSGYESENSSERSSKNSTISSPGKEKESNEDSQESSNLQTNCGSPPPLIPLEEHYLEVSDSGDNLSQPFAYQYEDSECYCTQYLIPESPCHSPPPLCPIDTESDENEYYSPYVANDEDCMSDKSYHFDTRQRDSVDNLSPERYGINGYHFTYRDDIENQKCFSQDVHVICAPDTPHVLWRERYS
ncbi:UNVERIFIED_CONTAM: hypothetical protein RMT77_007909 [Armadillidium vulgare]